MQNGGDAVEKQWGESYLVQVKNSKESGLLERMLNVAVNTSHIRNPHFERKGEEREISAASGTSYPRP